MNRKFFIVLSTIMLSIMVMATGCSEVTGSGKLVKENYDYSGFTTLEAGHGFNIVIEKASLFSVTITMDDNITEYLDIDQTGETLKITLKGGSAFINTTLEAKITMPEIAGINLSGGAKTEVTGFNSSNDFSVTLSGGSELKGDITSGDIGFGISDGSKVTLHGSGKNLMARSIGASKLMMEDFPVNDADINIDGGGSATLNISGKLDTVLTGGSRFLYIGEPEMGEINISGGSSLKKK